LVLVLITLVYRLSTFDCRCSNIEYQFTVLSENEH
jgi:hypothetical protein